MPRALYILSSDAYQRIYGGVQDQIARQVEFNAGPQTPASISAQPDLLRDVEIIFSGWGAPLFDQVFLDRAPHLKVVLYGAGSVKYMLTPVFWKRGIRLSSAVAANAVPVAEFTLGQFSCRSKEPGTMPTQCVLRKQRSRACRLPVAMAARWGLISLGLIGRRVWDLLRPFDLKVIAYDPFVSQAEAEALDLELCSLDEVFRRADVVSLHTPWLPETEGMITGEHFRMMKPYSTFINTARGAVVRETEMISVLRERPDIMALLDVTYPEPPEPESLLYTLPNVVLTPHIAGALGAECQRLGELVLDELGRYLRDEPLRHEVRREQIDILA